MNSGAPFQGSSNGLPTVCQLSVPTPFQRSSNGGASYPISKDMAVGGRPIRYWSRCRQDSECPRTVSPTLLGADAAHGRLVTATRSGRAWNQPNHKMDRLARSALFLALYELRAKTCANKGIGAQQCHDSNGLASLTDYHQLQKRVTPEGRNGSFRGGEAMPGGAAPGFASVRHIFWEANPESKSKPRTA